MKDSSGLDTPIMHNQNHGSNSRDGIRRSNSVSNRSSDATKERLLSAAAFASSNNQEEYGGIYGGVFDESRIVWTVADQLRLLALDDLQKRMLEFHNNIHLRGDEISTILSGTGNFNLSSYRYKDDFDNKSRESDGLSEKSFNSSNNASNHSQLIRANRLKISDYFSNNAKLSSRYLNDSASKMNDDVYQEQKSKNFSSKDTTMNYSSNILQDFEHGDVPVMAEYGCVAIKFISNSGSEICPIRLRKQDLGEFITSASKDSSNSKKGVKLGDNMDVSNMSSSSNGSSSISSSNNYSGAVGSGGGLGTGDGISPTSSNFIWFHLTDISYLSVLSKQYNIHEVCIASFYDFRANSSFISTASSCVISFCAFHLNIVDAELTKLVIYCQEGLVITFESAIMQDLLASRDDVMSKNGGGGGGNSNTSKNSNKDYVVDSSSPEYESVIFQRILEKLHRISGKAQELGIMYIAYQLALECLNVQDSIVEFLSRSLAFVKQEISSSVTYKQKLDLLQKMQSILNSSHLLHNNHLKYEKVLNILMEAASKSVNAGRISSSLTTYLVKDAHFIYIQDLIEAFEFSDDCIRCIVEALKESRIALDAIITLRTTNTSIFLSLVATTFLPLTFFAGVFGMNFSEGGDYSITLLNNPIGPNYFVGICVGSVVLILLYFISQGWIELFVPRWIARLFKQSFTSIDAIEREITIKEIEEAKLEEIKRNRKSNLLKSLQKTPVIVKESVSVHDSGSKSKIPIPVPVYGKSTISSPPINSK